ncbi:uncharacterized protein LOC144519589 isoform X2 [Sander vitreus]
MHPKQALSRILAESEASNVDFEDTEGFSLQDPGPLVLHRGSQCNIKCLQRSSAVQVKAEMVSVGTQTEWFEQQISTPLPSAVQSEDESSSDVMNQSDLSWIPDEEMSSESSDEENPEAPIQESLNDPNVADKFIVCLSQLIVVIVYHLLGLLWGNPGTNRVPGKDLHKNQAAVPFTFRAAWLLRPAVAAAVHQCKHFFPPSAPLHNSYHRTGLAERAERDHQRAEGDWECTARKC